MAMDLCINVKEEERGSEVQSDVRAKKRAGGKLGGGRRIWGASLSRSSFSSMQRSIAISLATFRFVMVHVLFYCHLASWPRLVFFTFGPDLFYLLLAPTCFIGCWPRLVLFTFGPDLFYFQLAPTCFTNFWPRLVLFSGCFNSFPVVVPCLGVLIANSGWAADALALG